MAGTSLLALIDDIASVLDDVSVMTKVAAKMPAMMVHCWPRKRAASTNDNSWVLSPISAMATMPSEVSKASK